MEMTNKQQENRATDRARARDKSTASTESMRQKFDILATNNKKAPSNHKSNANGIE